MADKSARDLQHFENWAATYEKSFLQRVLFRPVHTAMLAALVKNGQAQQPREIIDIGCGTGRLLRDASTLWPDANLFGIDTSSAMLEVAERLNSKADFKVASSDSLPFEANSADLILTSLSFHHWNDQGGAIREIARMLRPGGRFCLADHTFLFSRVTDGKAKSAGQIRSILENSGLTVIKQFRKRFILITLAEKRL